MDTSSAVKMDASGGSLRVDVVWSHVKAHPTPSSLLDPSGISYTTADVP